jgi:hypothetical protein
MKICRTDIKLKVNIVIRTERLFVHIYLPHKGMVLYCIVLYCIVIIRCTDIFITLYNCTDVSVELDTEYFEVEDRIILKTEVANPPGFRKELYQTARRQRSQHGQLPAVLLVAPVKMLDMANVELRPWT